MHNIKNGFFIRFKVMTLCWIQREYSILSHMTKYSFDIPDTRFDKI